MEIETERKVKYDRFIGTIEVDIERPIFSEKEVLNIKDVKIDGKYNLCRGHVSKEDYVISDIESESIVIDSIKTVIDSIGASYIFYHQNKDGGLNGVLDTLYLNMIPYYNSSAAIELKWYWKLENSVSRMNKTAWLEFCD